MEAKHPTLQWKTCAAVAQWIEYWPPKPRVVGSIPASRTKRNFATLRGGVFIWLEATYLLALREFRFRGATPSTAYGREFKGVSEGFKTKTRNAKPLNSLRCQ